MISKEITVSLCLKLARVIKDAYLSILSCRIQSKFRDCSFLSIFQQTFLYELSSVNKVWNN